MKTLKLLPLFAVALLFSHCGTTEPTTNTPTPSLLEVVNILDSARAIFIDAVEASGGNPHRAIQQSAGSLSKIHGIRYAYHVDSTYIHIVLHSGLKTGLWLNETDSAGNSIFRGGNTQDKTPPILRNVQPSTTLSKNTITNKKVLFFASAANSMLGLQLQLEGSINHITNSGLGLDVTVLRDQECRYDVLESFRDYGLVIIDTHGSEEGFLTGNSVNFGTTMKRSEDELKIIVDAQLRDGAYDKLANGELEIIFLVDAFSDDPNWIKKYTKDGPLITPILVHSKYIERLPEMSNTVIFGNMCYSGWINSFQYLPREEYKESDGTTRVIAEKTIEIMPIGKAFINKNPISYYGYTLDNPSGTSRPVKNNFAIAMEGLFIKRLVTNKDSTGIANRSDGDNTELFELGLPERSGDLFFRHYGKDDYSYNGCIDSFTDARDGRVYKAVCIGKQTWMAENLRYNAPGNLCYDDNTVKCDTFGRLYNWKTVIQDGAPSDASPSGVKGVCPNGWHLPSYDEFTTMINFLGGERAAGELMKDTKTWVNVNFSEGNNKSGFSGLGSGNGYLNSKGDHFFEFGNLRTSFWTTSLYNNNNTSHWTFSLSADTKEVLKYLHLEEDLISCRCVKDK